jgi:hypothetical protein
MRAHAAPLGFKVVAIAHIVVVTVAVVAISIIIAIAHVVAIWLAVVGVAVPRVIVAAIVVASAGVISVVVSARVIAIKIAIASVGFVVVKAVFLPHKGIRILVQSLLDVRMLLQVSLQRWMVLQELLIFHERWIAPKLFGGFAVTVKEAIELCQLSTAIIVLPVCVTPVRVAVTVLAGVIILPVVKTPRVIASRVFGAIVALFLMHKSIWISRFTLQCFNSTIFPNTSSNCRKVSSS